MSSVPTKRIYFLFLPKCLVYNIIDRNNMDVKVRVLYAWPNDQLSPDLADLWPNVGMAIAILDFMSIGIDTKRDWQMKSFSWCLPLNAKEGYRCVILILTSPLRYI